VAALRQHIESHERIHGIFTNGGAKPNIVPDLAEMLWYVRSGTSDSLARLEPRVIAALESGAVGTGSTFEFERTAPAYSDLVDSRSLVAAYVANLADRGRHPAPRETRPSFIGSTDMGNVSHEVPSIHPMIGVAPPGVAIHTPDFADHARSERGDSAIIDGAIGMARTIVDLWSDPVLLDAVRDEFSHAPRSPVAG
jgi:metal-dependent amidase/aminoacylase/carboxypeptidase family protein